MNLWQWMLLAAVCLVQWVLASYSTTVFLLKFVYFGVFVSPILAVLWITRDKRNPKIKQAHAAAARVNPVGAPSLNDTCDDSTSCATTARAEVLTKVYDDAPFFDTPERSYTTPVADVKQPESKSDASDQPKSRANFAIEYPYRPLLPSDSSQSIAPSLYGISPKPNVSHLEVQKHESSSDTRRVPNSIEAPPRKMEKGPTAARKRAKVFDPAHYSRHSGVPGFLYIARNDFYQPGLHKIGYTTLTPPERIKTLNQQHNHASDLGRFSLVFSSPVGGSYDAEQALFDAIATTRVAKKREYFLERSEFLIKALQAASIFNRGNPDALDEFLDWSLDQDSWKTHRPPILDEVTVPPKLNSTDEYIYVLRNPWHRESIFRFGRTKNDPRIKLAELNRKQRELTCQIGFYKLVECIAVDDLETMFPRFKVLVQPYKVVGSRTFVDMPLDSLTAAIIRAAEDPSVQASRNQARNRKAKQQATRASTDLFTEKSSSPTQGATTARRHAIPRSRKGWIDCPNCLSSIQLATDEDTICPECGWTEEQ